MLAACLVGTAAEVFAVTGEPPSPSTGPTFPNPPPPKPEPQQPPAPQPPPPKPPPAP